MSELCSSHPSRQRTLRAPKTPAQSTPPLRRDRDAAAVGRVAEDGRGRRQRGRRQGRPGAALGGQRAARVGRAQGAARRHAELRAGDAAPRRAGRVGGRAGHRAACCARGRGGGRDDAHFACGYHYKGSGADGLGVDVSLLEHMNSMDGCCGAGREDLPCGEDGKRGQETHGWRRAGSGT